MRRTLLLSSTFVASAVVAACTGGSSEPTAPSGTSSGTTNGTSSGGAGSSSGTTSGTSRATPQAIVAATLAGPDCEVAGEVVKIGDFGNPSAQPPLPSQPVKESGTWDGKVVDVSCSVKASGDELQVEGDVGFENGNVISLSGLFSTANPTEGVVTSVKVGTAAYESRNCTVELSLPGGVAAGRFWGKLACASVSDPSKPGACSLEAEVRLENCAQ